MNEQEKMQKIIQQVNESDMASMGNIVSGIFQLLNNPNSTINELKEIIIVDPPLAAKILKLANSAYYGSSVPIDEIDKALIWIGFDAVAELALNQKSLEMSDSQEIIGSYSSGLLWKHNVSVALFVKFLYRREFGERGESAYLAGLLHNIGTIAIDQFSHDEFTQILIESEASNRDQNIVEKEILGFDHAELGKAIVESWNLSSEIAQAIGFHHNLSNVSEDYSKMTTAIYLANYYVFKKNFGYSDSVHQAEKSFLQAVERLNIPPLSFKLIGKDVESELNKMKESGLI